MVINCLKHSQDIFFLPYFYFPQPLKYLSLKLEIMPCKRICTTLFRPDFCQTHKLINRTADHRDIYFGFLWIIESDFLLDIIE